MLSLTLRWRNVIAHASLEKSIWQWLIQNLGNAKLLNIKILLLLDTYVCVFGGSSIFVFKSFALRNFLIISSIEEAD